MPFYTHFVRVLHMLVFNVNRFAPDCFVETCDKMICFFLPSFFFEPYHTPSICFVHNNISFDSLYRCPNPVIRVQTKNSLLDPVDFIFS